MDQSRKSRKDQRLPPYPLELRGMWDEVDDADNQYRGFEDTVEDFPRVPMETDDFIPVPGTSAAGSSQPVLSISQILARDARIRKKGVAPAGVDTRPNFVEPPLKISKIAAHELENSFSSSTASTAQQSPLLGETLNSDPHAPEFEYQGMDDTDEDREINNRVYDSDYSCDGLFTLTDGRSNEELYRSMERAKHQYRMRRLGFVEAVSQQNGIPAEFAQFGELPKCPRGDNNHNRGYFTTILDVTGPEDFYVGFPWHPIANGDLHFELIELYGKPIFSLPMTDYGDPKPEFLIPGQAVVCFYNNEWRRGQILSVIPNDPSVHDPEAKLYIVLLLDEGEKIEVTIKEIRYMNRRLLKCMVNAMKCVLDKSEESVLWTIAAADRFRTVVLKKTRIHLKFIRQDPNDPRAWIVRFQVNIMGGSPHDIRNVDIGLEIGTYERRTNIASMFKPPTDLNERQGNNPDTTAAEYATEFHKKQKEHTVPNS